MKSFDARNNDQFLRNQFFMDGDFSMPFVYSQDVTLENIKLLGFNNTHTNENSASQKDKTIHFFLDDYKFDEVWNQPEAQLKKLSQYRQVLSPGFSLYSDMPEPLQIYNSFRNRWCGAYWQYNSLLVIPTIVWGADNTFEFCFDAIEKGSVVAVSTLGVYDMENVFMAGFRAMCDKIEPKMVLNYGKEFVEMGSCAKVVSAPYVHGSQHKTDSEAGIETGK